MTSLKTKSICFLAAFLFLSIVPTLAAVVNGVQNCIQFFLPLNGQGTPPNIPGVLVNGAIIPDQNHPNRYRVICQTFNNVPRFLTVYDTVNRIPVFSAYEYTGSVPGRCDITWMVEPQLENPGNDVNMRAGGHNIINNQAVNAVYDNQNPNIYDKGHLFPVSHAPDYVDQISTLTLTNAVPQHQNFNRGRWSQMEQDMRNTMNQQINNGHRCFVVVGAVHSDNNVPDIWLQRNVNNIPVNWVKVPVRMWSAFYCTNQRSGAYWDNNVAGANPLTERTLPDLRNDLGIVPFPGAP